jgi:predicted glycoside hydrolase/deacetylase ChbG (UPF0249 family)
MRIPDEPPQGHLNDRFLEAEARMFGGFAAEARPCAATSTVRVPDHFRGLYLKGRLKPSLLKNTLEHLPDGLTELMVHPGRVPAGKLPGPFSSFSTRDRETELMVLLGEEFRDALSEYGVCLTPFPEVNA